MKRKKSVRIVKGDGLLTVIDERQVKREDQPKVYQTKIQKCLNCTKPASKCKGDCK
jgi:hypothetical protein